MDKNKLRMILTANEDSDVECVLWDECSSNAYSDYIVNKATPVVVVINQCRIGFSEDGMPLISNSYNAIRVLFNPDIQEVKTFIASCKDGVTPICTPLSQPFSFSQQSQQPSSVMLSKDSRTPISEVPNQALGDAFVVNGKFLKLETTHGWVYEGCGKCSSKIKEENGAFKCFTCKKSPNSIQPKLKIHYTISDDTGTASIVFWDKLASQLVDKSAAQLKFILKEENREYDIPDQLDAPIGKRALIQLKRNHYNSDHPSSSISVVQYLMCEDLMEPFLKADDAKDDKVHANPPPVNESALSNNVCLDSQDGSGSSQVIPTCVHLVDDDDIPLAELSRSVASKKTRTKKHLKRMAHSHDKNASPSVNYSVKEKGKPRMLKAIKKEK